MNNFTKFLFFLVMVIIDLTVCMAQPYEGYQYLSPKPNASGVDKSSIIVIRFEQILRTDNLNRSDLISVTGSESGVTRGQIRLASDNKTINFNPLLPFTEGETVYVSITPHLKNRNTPQLKSISYSFTIGNSEPELPMIEKKPVPEPEIDNLTTPLKLNQLKESGTVGRATISANGVAIPSDFPGFTVTTNINPSAGYIFLNNWGNQPYNMILDNDCNPVWYWRTPDRRRDFKVQKVGNDSILTMLVRSGYPFGQGYIALNNQYTVIDSFYSVNGYSTDEHELQVLENGNYIVIGIRNRTIDHPTLGRVSINESNFQEFTGEGDLLMDWQPLEEGHFDLLDIDPIWVGEPHFPHMNSVDIDDDGNYILSSRHLSEVTKINRQTGEIIWRFGGKNNQFTILNDPLNGFSSQHDVRVQGNGHYTMFDNGNGHNPPTSRAVEYVLNTEDSLASMVWEYRYVQQNPNDQSHFMGNAQRLPSGNTQINWAEYWLPKVTEVTPDGEKVYEMNFLYGEYCYRAFRFPWHGVADVPYLVAESHREGVVLIMNKFGDANVDYYRIYGDQSNEPTTEITTSQSPLLTLRDLTNDETYYFRIKSVDKTGKESAFSNIERVRVKLLTPGENMVTNGDFSRRSNSWQFGAASGSSASIQTSDSICHISITNGGNDRNYIALYQQNLELLRGEEYALEFDAWADESRIIEAAVLNPYIEPYLQYAKIGVSAIDTVVYKHYSYTFSMVEQSNFDAFLVFFVGGSNADVYLDNISLKRVVSTPVEEIANTDLLKYELAANYPNPFNAETIFRFSIPVKSRVTLSMYDILGRHVADIVRQTYNPGNHTARFNGNNLSSGTYFCRMTAQDLNTMKNFTKVRKIILIK